MKIHQIISSINDFICTPEISGELNMVLPHSFDSSGVIEFFYKGAM
jgi:hypothetical protein